MKWRERRKACVLHAKSLPCEMSTSMLRCREERSPGPKRGGHGVQVSCRQRRGPGFGSRGAARGRHSQLPAMLPVSLRYNSLCFNTLITQTHSWGKSKCAWTKTQGSSAASRPWEHFWIHKTWNWEKRPTKQSEQLNKTHVAALFVAGIFNIFWNMHRTFFSLLLCTFC